MDFESCVEFEGWKSAVIVPLYRGKYMWEYLWIESVE